MNWLLLIHQIPAKPTYFRAKIWRRLQQIGAVAIKQAAYVMPPSASANEDLRWIAKEIIESGGEAVLLEATLQEGLGDEQVIKLFQKARRAEYEKILQEAEAVMELWNGAEGRDVLLLDCRTSLTKLRKAFAGQTAIDFFPGSDKARVEAYLVDMETIFSKPPARHEPLRAYELNELAGKTWVTQINIYVDRMASAWFIRRFIDEAASLKFVKGTRYQPGKEEIRYDMMEAEFTHQGELCTFEVLVHTFAADDEALHQLARVIHDIDLKEDAFGLAETPGVQALFDGIAATEPDDMKRVERAAAMLDELLACFKAKHKKD